MSFKSVMLAGALLLAGMGVASAATVTNDLNVRSGPGTGYGVVTTLPAGAEVGVIGCTGSWCQVSFGGGEGFVSASYLAGDSGPVYAAAPPVYVGPAIGLGFGFGGGWHHGWRGGRGWHGGGGWHGGHHHH